MGILANIKHNTKFQHHLARVDQIEADTANFHAKLQRQVTAIRNLNPGIDDKDIFFFADMWDGIPVDPNLGRLCYAIREVNRRVKFGVRSNCAFRAQSPRTGVAGAAFSMLCEVWVYLPEQPYALMRIGRKNYTTSANASSEPTYGVYSRLIQNRKYDDSNQQHCMLMSSDLTRAIKNAKAVMRPYAPQEVVQVYLHTFVACVQSETSTINSEVSDAASSVRSSSDLMKEMVHLVESGYQFVSTDLRDRVIKFMEVRKAQQEHLSKIRHAWFVTVITRNDEQHFDVIEMFDVHKTAPTMHDPQTYKPETLPEEIAGKMAVLTMVDVGTRVPDVGMRATETTFYVERV